MHVPPPNNDYTAFLEPDALRGARIGIPRAFYYDRITPPGGKEPRGGLNEAQAKAMQEAIGILKQLGAEIIDRPTFRAWLKLTPQRRSWTGTSAAQPPTSEAKTLTAPSS